MTSRWHHRWALSAVLATFAMIALGCSDDGGSTSSAPPTKPTVAVIPKGTTHVFWKSVETGAKRAGAELGYDIIWKGPLSEGDRAQQRQLVQQFINDQVDAIVLAPTDAKALVDPVKDAAAKGIPVVIIDSGLDAEAGADYVTFIATNNHQGGKLGGEKLAELLGDGGDVVMLRYQVGSASTHDREEGFLEAINAADNINVLSSDQYAGTSKGQALKKAREMKDVIEKARGVFAPNESSTAGMLEALRTFGLAGKITFVGFDSSPELVAALRAGEIDALVVQNPDRMGYEGVRAAAKALDGETLATTIDTGVMVITPDNIDSPQVKALLGE